MGICIFYAVSIEHRAGLLLDNFKNPTNAKVGWDDEWVLYSNSIVLLCILSSFRLKIIYNTDKNILMGLTYKVIKIRLSGEEPLLNV